jgi:adenylylsulfate kinase
MVSQLGVIPGFAVWLTGLPSSGKTSVARALADLLAGKTGPIEILDSDEMRQHLTPRPTYSSEERDWFYRVIGYIASLLTRNGVDLLIAATGPLQAHRDQARQQIDRFVEVFVRCSPEECRRRDPKRLWRKAALGEIHNLPGAGGLYEPPQSPEIEVNTERLTAEQAAKEVFRGLQAKGLI